MATILHSKDFKQSHINSHNASLKKLADKWAKCGSVMAFRELTLAEVVAAPGHYIKDRGQWKGPFSTEIDAQDAKAEWDYESKHG